MQDKNADNIIYCDGELAIMLGAGKEIIDYTFSNAEAGAMLLSAYAKLRDRGHTDCWLG